MDISKFFYFCNSVVFRYSTIGCFNEKGLSFDKLTKVHFCKVPFIQVQVRERVYLNEWAGDFNYKFSQTLFGIYWCLHIKKRVAIKFCFR